jgi:hypothetical protein
MGRFRNNFMANFVVIEYGERSDAGGSKELSFGVGPRSNTEGNTASRRLGSDRKD